MWIQTYTGRKFWPLFPHESDVCIEDIAHALAMKCRYNGHCLRFLSIAQHSVMVSAMVPASDALWGLLHDAAEAYLPGVMRPIKGAICVAYGHDQTIRSFNVIEHAILTAVAHHFGLGRMPPTITPADLCCLERERRQFMVNPPEESSTAKFWDGDTTPIESWTPERAEREFLARFASLADAAERLEEEVRRAKT